MASLWVPMSVPYLDLGEHPHPRRCGILQSRTKERGAPSTMQLEGAGVPACLGDSDGTVSVDG